jgi:hypothetical protein
MYKLKEFKFKADKFILNFVLQEQFYYICQLGVPDYYR